jgi:glycosyltransferase involved in cell wall biosynthesis
VLRVCQVVASINRDTGGPAITVPGLAKSLARQDVACTLVTLDYPDLGPQTACPDIEVIAVPAGWLTRRARGWSGPFRSRLQQQAAKSDAIHSHGLWMFPNLYARQAAVRARIPLVVSPRGMLEEWSLGRSRVKKFVAWQLFERKNLATAALLHVTSDSEGCFLRKLGLRPPIAVIPNGVDMPDPRSLPRREVIERNNPALIGQRWLLFLSRIHPKKGVSELLSAWRDLEADFPDWQLVVAGPDLDGHGKVAREQAAVLGLGKRVTFTGPLAGIEKESALANAELFVLPTHSENFGVAIAEALAFALPVVTTRGAPWRELETHRCGWWIELTHFSLVHWLRVALTSRPAELREMGSRGRAMVEEKYSWNRVGEQMKQSYEWILGRGDKPSFVQIAD